ncbi:MAG TPA: DnaJ domain-containing protein [Thermoanaerobaculia bacterium]|nr:DnaJ domain-containing protein [Thermoanaerobaculia bacterium]
MKVNYYDVLGLERSASEQDIRDRFRKLAREQHPDRYKGADKASAESRFQTLTEAMNVLTNADRRRAYDAELASGLSQAATDPVQIAKAYLNRGIKAINERDWAAAYESLDMAVKHNPQDAKALHLLARAASRIPAKARQAVQAIEAAVQKEPHNPVYLRDAGLICKSAGLPAKAERYLEQALQWDSGNAEVNRALAEIRQSRPESKEGAKGFTLFRKS